MASRAYPSREPRSHASTSPIRLLIFVTASRPRTARAPISLTKFSSAKQTELPSSLKHPVTFPYFSNWRPLRDPDPKPTWACSRQRPHRSGRNCSTPRDCYAVRAGLRLKRTLTPIWITVRALWSLGVNANHVVYNFDFWRVYTSFCRKHAEEAGREKSVRAMRELRSAAYLCKPGP